MKTQKERDEFATKLFTQGRFSEALKIADDLCEEGYPPSFFLAGLINEFRTDSKENLDTARELYIRASSLTGNPSIDVHLGRVNLKLGDRQRALRYVSSALKNRIFPDAFLLAGDFYSWRFQEGKVMPTKEDMEVAADNYLRGGLRGRSYGLRRYVLMQMHLGHQVRFVVMSLFLPLVDAILAATFGRAAKKTY